MYICWGKFLPDGSLNHVMPVFFRFSIRISDILVQKRKVVPRQLCRPLKPQLQGSPRLCWMRECYLCEPSVLCFNTQLYLLFERPRYTMYCISDWTGAEVQKRSNVCGSPCLLDRAATLRQTWGVELLLFCKGIIQANQERQERATG